MRPRRKAQPQPAVRVVPEGAGVTRCESGRVRLLYDTEGPSWLLTATGVLELTEPTALRELVRLLNHPDVRALIEG